MNFEQSSLTEGRYPTEIDRDRDWRRSFPRSVSSPQQLPNERHAEPGIFRFEQHSLADGEKERIPCHDKVSPLVTLFYSTLGIGPHEHRPLG